MLWDQVSPIKSVDSWQSPVISVLVLLASIGLCGWSIQTGIAVPQGKPILDMTSDQDDQLPLQVITFRINQYQSDRRSCG
jgi:hypothetical protein